MKEKITDLQSCHIPSFVFIENKRILNKNLKILCILAKRRRKGMMNNLCADQKGKSDLYKNSYNVMTLYKCGYHFGTGLLQSVN